MIIESKDLISFFITLYAVVPSIVITVMYGFLSNVEAELANIWHETRGNDDFVKRSSEINKFVIITSKIFHVSMTYYLILLFSALISKCFPVESCSCILIVCWASVGYFVYFLFYFSSDIYGSLDEVFFPFSENKKEFHSVVTLIYLIYGIIPILLPNLFWFLFCKGLIVEEIFIQLWWVSLTILHLLFWWLIVPFKYKPLTHLSFIKKKLPRSEQKTSTYNFYFNK